MQECLTQKPNANRRGIDVRYGNLDIEGKLVILRNTLKNAAKYLLATISQSDMPRQIVVHVLEIGKVILLSERRMVLAWLHSQIEKVDFFYV